MRALLAIAILAALALVGFTWWALESGGVAVLETRAADGSVRKTHVWFVERDGELWIEAGTPENSWWVDVQREPELVFTSPDGSGRFVAERVETPGAHDEIRSRLRTKYGVRDWWVGVLFDTSRSIAVVLRPADG